MKNNNFTGYDDDLDYFDINFKDIEFKNFGSEIYIKDKSKNHDNVFCIKEYNLMQEFLSWLKVNNCEIIGNL